MKHATVIRAEPQPMECGMCLHVFEVVLTDELAAPVCPNCGHVGDRQVSTEYPMGTLAGRATGSRADEGIRAGAAATRPENMGGIPAAVGNAPHNDRRRMTPDRVVQSQDSLRDQIYRVLVLAHKNGEWDAADWIARHFFEEMPDE